jgi:ADP-ribose pyrophosphatase YjhB (NUDIX family)
MGYAPFAKGEVQSASYAQVLQTSIDLGLCCPYSRLKCIPSIQRKGRLAYTAGGSEAAGLRSHPVIEILDGTFETRFIRRLSIDNHKLQDILHKPTSAPTERSMSLNLMVITTDEKILLLQRSQSFHYKLVHRNLAVNDIRIGLLESLYPSELCEVYKKFFNFLNLPPEFRFGGSRNIHIFPGGHSTRSETVITTLLREFQEETSIRIKHENLRFNKSCVFKVTIYDKIVSRWFDNLVFPALINMSSVDIMNQFKTTKHTRCPTFLNVNCLSPTGQRPVGKVRSALARSEGHVPLTLIASHQRPVTDRCRPSVPPTLAEGESKPAEGESKPAEGESKPAEGESKPAEGRCSGLWAAAGVRFDTVASFMEIQRFMLL